MTTTQEIIDKHQQYVMPTYAPEIALVKGRGAKVWDADGKEYLDFITGISVLNVGHCNPRVVRAIKEQASRLMHVSNLYYNEPQPRLAEALSTRSLGGKCFFCNSGAEANEALIKLARLWGQPHGKFEIVSLSNSFHGRTLATLTATGQTKVQKGFEPLPAGFVLAEFNDLESCAEAINDRTAAVLVEAFQGEGGVVPADADFLPGLKALCDRREALLFCDEVQCGMGRTGKWFGYEHYGIQPDAISLAKGLGGGLSIGGIVTSPALSEVFRPGHHATTFGGNPVACAAALAVIEVIEEDGLLENAAVRGDELTKKLERLVKKHPFLTEVRGKGLIVGLVLDRPAKPLEQRLREKGLLTLATADTVLRLLPPLNIKKSQIGKAVAMIDEACTDWERFV